MKRKTLFWIVLFAVIALAAGGYSMFAGTEGTTASVYVNGELYDSFDLTTVVIPYEITVHTETGYNTLRVSHGAIEVAEANCPGQDCVHQGQIHDSLLPIVCLPHKLVIQIDE